MTIRHLKIFTETAAAGGMSKAAQRLHISQPTVSQAVAELEKYYGVKLFERLSQKIYLTKEGELMLSFSRHILDSFEQMEEAMNQAAEKTSVRIGCSVSVGTCLINDVLDKAKERMPECSVSVLVSNSADIEQAILNNQVDLGIVEGILKSSDLLVTPVCEDELAVVCGRQHALAGKKTVSLKMLDGQDYVSRESGSAERNQIEKMLEDSGLHLNRTFCSTNTEAIKNAVIRGRGIAIFSKRVVEKECRTGELVILPLEAGAVTRNINLVIHKNKYVSQSIRTIEEIVRALN
ncbi:MAG: LysR family transcriptional regulator [Lachnospiraceae bacterium]|nr:LysR family transcriptional regulator [Lachnospiraceae bacterium]